MKLLKAATMAALIFTYAATASGQNYNSVALLQSGYMNWDIPVTVTGDKANIADFARAFSSYYSELFLCQELGKYLQNDNYSNPDVEEYILDIPAGYMHLEYGFNYRLMEMRDWDMPDGVKRVGVLLWDQEDPDDYSEPYLVFYDYYADRGQMEPVYPQPLNAEVEYAHTAVYFSREGTDIVLVDAASGMPGYFHFAGAEGFNFEGPGVLVGEGGGEFEDYYGEEAPGFLYCLFDAEKDTNVYDADGSVLTTVPAGQYTVIVQNNQEGGLWKVMDSGYSTRDDWFLIMEDHDVYLKAGQLAIYTIHKNGSVATLYTEMDADSAVVTTFSVPTLLIPVYSRDDYDWIYVRSGNYAGWVQVAETYSSPVIPDTYFDFLVE